MSVSVAANNSPVELNCGLGGSIVTNRGTVDVSYTDDYSSLVASGVIQPGGNVTLFGRQYFFVTSGSASITTTPAGNAGPVGDSTVYIGSADPTSNAKDSDVWINASGGIKARTSGTWTPVAAREAWIPLNIDSTLSVGSESLRWPLRAAGMIKSVSLVVRTGPDGDDLLVDIRNKGNSVFVTDTNTAVPFIEDGSFDSPAFSVASATSTFAAGDYLTAYVTQVGSSTPGAQLRAIVHVEFSEDEVLTAPTTPVHYTPYQRAIHDTPGLIAYWRMDETSGTTVRDDVGTYDGALFDTYTQAATGLLTTESNTGISFTGGGGEIRMSSLPLFTGNDPWTYEGWFKPTTVDNVFRRVLIQLSGGNGIGIFNRSGTGFYLNRQVGGGQVSAISSVVGAGTTVHFAATYDGSVLRLYVNGLLAASASDTRSMPAGSQIFYIGQETVGGTGLAPGLGTYDEFAVYNLALDPDTVLAHYVVGSGYTPPPPDPLELEFTNRTMYSDVALFAKLDETSGTTVAAQKRRRIFFEKGGFVNGRLSDAAPLDPDPNGYTAMLGAQANSPGTYVNYASWSKPVYLGDYDVSHIAVADTDGFMNADNSVYKWGSGTKVPWNQYWRSADAEITESTYRDKHIITIDTTVDRLYEIFHAYHYDTGPGTLPHRWDTGVTARHGGKADDLSTFSGAFPSPYGASGTGISTLAGLVRFEEVEAGEIPHCIAFATPLGAPGHVSPATRGDQGATTGNRIVEGQIYRLPADFDVATFVSTYKCAYVVELMLYAIQRYGMVCMDASAGTVSFYLEDLRDPSTGLSTNASWAPHLVSRYGRKSITGDASTDTFTSANHGFNNNDSVFLYDLVGGAGLVDVTSGQGYKIVNRTSNTFQVSLTAGGPAVNFTTNLTSGTAGYIQPGWYLTRVQNFPWSQLKLMPAYDSANTYRTDSTWNDLVGTHSGLLTAGQASLTANPSAKSVLYSGGKTTFADDPVFDVGAEITISAMVKTSTVAAGEAIIMHRDVYELKRSGSSLVGSVVIGAVTKSCTAAGVFSAGTACQVAMTYDGSNVQLYKNGVAVGSATPAAGSIDASSDAIVAGSLSDGTKAWSGNLQHLVVLGEALSAGRLLVDYTSITT